MRFFSRVRHGSTSGSAATAALTSLGLACGGSGAFCEPMVNRGQPSHSSDHWLRSAKPRSVRWNWQPANAAVRRQPASAYRRRLRVQNDTTRSPHYYAGSAKQQRKIRYNQQNLPRPPRGLPAARKKRPADLRPAGSGIGGDLKKPPIPWPLLRRRSGWGCESPSRFGQRRARSPVARPLASPPLPISLRRASPGIRGAIGSSRRPCRPG